jgi:hypothetical protein
MKTVFGELQLANPTIALAPGHGYFGCQIHN